MALDAGDSTVQSGTMARSIYDALETAFGALTGDDDDNRKEACAAIAKGVVEHIKAHGDVIITTSDGGLQVADGAGNPTLAPDSNKTISGAVD